MKAAIIRPHKAGLFSLINNVITCAHHYEYVYVDWSGENCRYRSNRNVWDALFEPNVHPSEVADIESIDVINEFHEDRSFTYKHAANLYGRDWWRGHCHLLWRNKLRPQQRFLDQAARFIANLNPRNRRMVSLIIRSHPHAGEQITNRSQTFAQYDAEIAKHREEDPEAIIFMVPGSYEAANYFVDKWDAWHHPDSVLTVARETDSLSHEQTEDSAKQIFTEILIAAAADYLVHPVSNMATAALYINPLLRSVFIP